VPHLADTKGFKLTGHPFTLLPLFTAHGKLGFPGSSSEFPIAGASCEKSRD